MTGGMTLLNNNKRTIRATPNPLDKATVVSIFPQAIEARMHTVQPGYFKLEAGTIDKPSLLVVGPASWWRDIGEEMPLIEITNSAIQVADSIVKDTANCMLMSNMMDSMPGLFFVPGEHDIESIRKNFSSALKDAETKQKNWFNQLVRLADVGWARTNGSPNAISDLMRLAAQGLSLNDRPWMANATEIHKVQCVACGNLRNPQFPICPTCNRIVDVKLAEKLGIVEVTKK